MSDAEEPNGRPGRHFSRALSVLLAGSDALAAAALAGLLGVVSGSVAARALSDLTGGAIDLQIPGAIELARYALLVMVFAALPRAFASGLVRVELLAERLPHRLQRALGRVWAGLGAALGLVLAWQLGEEAWLKAGRGDATQDLGLALWPFLAFAALAAGLLAAVSLARMVGPGPGA